MNTGDKKPRADTTEQLRADIDSGRTGDKVRVSDPAAAPLGTDEEAAGTPPDGATIRQARRQETARSPANTDTRRRSIRHYQIGGVVVVLAIIVVLILAFLGPWGEPEPAPGRVTPEETVPG